MEWSSASLRPRETRKQGASLLSLLSSAHTCVSELPLSPQRVGRCTLQDRIVWNARGAQAWQGLDEVAESTLQPQCW